MSETLTGEVETEVTMEKSSPCVSVTTDRNFSRLIHQFLWGEGFV